jgi:hypothetical protein
MERLLVQDREMERLLVQDREMERRLVQDREMERRLVQDRDIFSQRKGISWLAEEREKQGEVVHSSAVHVREDQPFILKSPNPLVISSTAASVAEAGAVALPWMLSCKSAMRIGQIWTTQAWGSM